MLPIGRRMTLKMPTANLLDGGAVDSALRRLDALRADARRQWGTMDVAQMVAHVSNNLELAMG